MSFIKYITLEEELKKNPELKMSDIQILREWCEKKPHLPKIQDIQLAVFLHRDYYQIELAKKTIENYYTIRTHLPELFCNRDLLEVKDLRDTYKVLPTFILEERTKEGYIIMAGKFFDTNPAHYSFINTIKCSFMGFDEYLWTRGTVPGIIYIMDATGSTIGHIGRISPAGLKKFACYIQDGYPARLKAIHIINTSPFIDIFFGMLKVLVKPDFMEIIHIHSSLESANKYFPVDALPNELSGKAGPAQKLVDKQIKKVQNFREWYMEDEKMNRVNESLRIGESKTYSDLFGMEGSFKKLEVD